MGEGRGVGVQGQWDEFGGAVRGSSLETWLASGSEALGTFGYLGLKREP